MRARRAPALWLALLLAAGPSAAEAPEQSLRPEPRAAVAPGPPALRPEARPPAEAAAQVLAAGPLAVELRADGSPVAQVAVAPPAAPGTPQAAPRPARDYLPMLGRRPPLLLPDRGAPRLLGPRAVVRAEEAMAVPFIPVVTEAWTRVEPRARPGTLGEAGGGALVEPAAEGAAAPPGRPRARPQPDRPEAPDAPREPPAPDAYAPGEAPAFRPGPDATPQAVAEAVPPLPRPQGIVARAEQARAEAVRGQVCGNPLLQGEAEASFSSGGCGIDDPVRLRSVDGVRLSEPALMDCRTAEALLTWVQQGARPALAGRGGGLARIDLMGHYACRPRNNQAGQRLSEHGRGHAIDVGGVTLADGTAITVLQDWPGGGLREMHRAACGPFSTVLGPEANAFHRNHLHLDTARGRGPYCR